MGKVYERIDPSLKQFIEDQKVFFVATAPLAENGHINVSPKGLDSLRVLDEQTVAYADLTGSGIETVAHVKENGRIVIMFCAFDGSPNIIRLHGFGEVITPEHHDFESLQEQFPACEGLRCFVRVKCQRISDSCGWGVPKYEFREDRTQLTAWARTKGLSGIEEYQREKNATSLDGLDGLA